MRKRRWASALLVTALLPLAACGAVEDLTDPGTTVLDTIVNMSVEDKVGQLFVVSGSDADLMEAVSDYHVGGVIYFGPNVADKDASTLDLLSIGLQRESRQEGAPDLFIGIDREPDLRPVSGMTYVPDQHILGAEWSEDEVEAASRLTAEELLTRGINVNFAPVADVCGDPDCLMSTRSFGGDPLRVASYTSAAIRGYQAGGVAATAKHFPGYGTASGNSDLEPVVRRVAGLDQLRADLAPFRAAIAAGTKLVMTGNFITPGYDAELPASLSPAITTNLLRGEMGFEGVVITDALQGGALSNYGDAGEIAVQAFLAGNDLLLMPGDLSLAYETVLAAVRSGKITEGRLNDSVRRILAAKQP